MLIDEDIRKIYDLPDSWDLVAQMVFGEKLQDAPPIEKISVGERVQVFKK